MTDTTDRPAADPKLARAQQRFANRQRLVRRRSWLPWLAAGFAVVFGVFAVWLFGFSKVFSVSEVEVTGAETVSADAVRQTAHVPLGVPLARVDLDRIAERVRAIPVVADVQVNRVWPRGVVIRVIERMPVVVVANGSRYQLVDGTGVAYRTVAAVPEGLPQAVVRGSRRTVTIRSVVTVAAALPDGLRAQVITISAASPDSITLHLPSGVKVVWGSSDDSARKAEVLTVLMKRQAEVYDVSAPDLPVTKGEKR